MIRPQKILEIGVAEGATARRLLDATDADYVGVDLFEDLTDSRSNAEGNGKRVAAVDELRKELYPRATLYKGDTREILPTLADGWRMVGTRFDLVFIDGGHSIDTVRNDFECSLRVLADDGYIVLDDYYEGENAPVDMGCRQLVDNLDRSRFEVRIMEPADVFTTGLKGFPGTEDTVIRLAQVRLR